MNKRLVSFLLIVLLILTVTSICSAADQSVVRVLYFQPKGAEPVNHQKYDTIINNIQTFFRQEMIRLDFGDKTFRIETDNSVDLLIHTVLGHHPGDHYTGEVFNTYYQNMAKEIPFAINNTTNRREQNNIYIILLGNVEIVNDGLGSPWGSP